MTKTIVITPSGFAKYGNNERKRFEEKGYTLDVNETGKSYTKEQFLEKASKATALIVGVDTCSKEVLEQCKDLKAIVKYGAGIDNIDVDAAKELGIEVGRCVGCNANAVAELTIGLMLCASRHIVPSAINVRDGGWNKYTGYELTGKTVGIIGFGHIGQLVAKMCHFGYGMKVLAFDAFPIKQEVLDSTGAVVTKVEDILKNADYVTVHVPLMDSTRGMISTKEFDSMKDTAILINTARGGIVDEKALYDALKNKKIFASASDVFTSEPPANEDWIQELIHMDNFILTSHIASRSQEAETLLAEVATNTILELLEKNK